MNQKETSQLRKQKELVRQLIHAHYPKKAIKIESLSGGLNNLVFAVTRGKEELVVRLSEKREQINFFQKEQWAVLRAKEAGIPVPEILEVGNDIIPLPYMIMRRTAGEPAIHHADRRKIIKDLGRYAAMINKIPTQGYGHMFDWSQNTLTKNNTWKDFLDCEINTNERLAILKKYKMLPAAAFKKLKSGIAIIQKWSQRATLQHGDLRLKNTMVDRAGKIVAIIDWDNAISAIAPYWDLSIALHDLSIDAQYEFLQGYGINDKQLLNIAPAIKVLNLLNYAPVIERLVREKQTADLNHHRARLHGALDMYSLV